MRRAIETAPRDGKLVILEDGTSRTFALGRWSTSENAWVGEDGKPLANIPTHWLPRLGEATLEGDKGFSPETPKQYDPSVSRLQQDGWTQNDLSCANEPVIKASHSCAPRGPHSADLLPCG